HSPLRRSHKAKEETIEEVLRYFACAVERRSEVCLREGMRAIHYWLGANWQCASIARSWSLFCKKGLQGPIAAHPRGGPRVQQITGKEDWTFSRYLLKTIRRFFICMSGSAAVM